MILLNNQRLYADIEKYNKILDDLVVMPLETEKRFSIFQKKLLTPKYQESKQEIENYIFQLFDKVNGVDTLAIALFVFRSVTKRKMYSDNFADWTVRFKICNHLFFLALKYLKNSKRTLYVTGNDRVIITKIFFLGYTTFENEVLFNEQDFLDNKDLTDKFFKVIQQISNRNGDLHSYQITNNDLKKYLNIKNISHQKIRENALGKYEQQYLSKSELTNNISWKKILSHDNISNPKDDIIIIPICAFNKYDKQLQSFINNFEVSKCCSPSDPENELIFAYKTDNYLYISKKILYDAQTIIEDSITWGQYGNLTKYFLDSPIDQDTLKNYNRLMTYKIADLLLSNDYILPMEIAYRLSIPRIEISNYVIDKNQKNELGDIDLLFYSNNSKTLYLIEYKNYQMMISRKGDLNAEISKVSRENTPEKVTKRHKYICSQIEYCQDTLFNHKYDISDIKSVILTTKPCYYYYVNKSENYEYMEWVEFENKVLSKEL